MHKDEWPATDTRSVVWRLIFAAGPQGMARSALMDAAGKSSTAIDWHLTNLHRDGYIKRTNDRSRGDWAAAKWPPIAGLVRDMALEALEDCPAGVSDDVLYSALQVPWADSLAVLEQALADGLVQRIEIPVAHSSSYGWRLAKAKDEPELLIPVFTADIDRIHRTRAEQPSSSLDCRMLGERLQLVVNGLTVTLTEGQTGKLADYLLSEMAR
ncbi:MAG TPA: hypothetical protein PKE15_00045 [Ottowia sp.]|nr:hypothetical protein [Ottowia sp.]